MHWLPAPTLEKPGSDRLYQSFEQTYTDAEPSDDARPGRSADVQPSIPLPKPTFKLTKQTARRIVFCTDCTKPRLLFSQKQLSSDQDKQLDAALDQLEFSCRSPLFEEGDELEGVVFQHWQSCCALTIDLKYYQNADRLFGYKWLCSSCLDTAQGDWIEDADYKGLPRCLSCKEQDIEPQQNQKVGAPKRKRV